MSKISVVNLCKEYDKGKPVVIDANLEIQEKEFIVFVGPSGCGKSTMLRMIAGLEEITSGDLFIDGKRVNDIAPMHRNIAMVFQNYALYPHMTIRKNLEFGLANMKVDKATIKQKVEDTSKMLGLEEYLNRKPAALSGGQRQRVAVGRALIKDSDIFLMDEPLSNLDAQLRVQMRAEITQLCKRIGATTIYVTHDQTEAMTMADRIVIMRDGVIQQIGTPREVYNDPQNLFVASFIGSPKINILPGTISDSKLKFGVVEMSLDADVLAKLDGRAKASVGIRPEDFSLEPKDNCVEMPLRVDYTELLGSEILVYSYNDSYNLILKLDKQFAPNTGDMITAYVEKEKLYLFDTETERRI